MVIINNQLQPGGISELTRHVHGPPFFVCLSGEQTTSGLVVFFL